MMMMIGDGGNDKQQQQHLKTQFHFEHHQSSIDSKIPFLGNLFVLVDRSVVVVVHVIPIFFYH